MPTIARSGTKGLIKRHRKGRECPGYRVLTRCDCKWRGKKGPTEVILEDWMRPTGTLDPRKKEPALKVLRRFLAAVDTPGFDIKAEKPAIGSPDTLAAFITEWQSRYADKELTSNSLAAVVNVISTGRLGGYTLEKLAGNTEEIQNWLDDEGKKRNWCAKTWNNYHDQLSAIFRQAVRWTKDGKPRMAFNPMASIERKVPVEPDLFRVRHLEEPVEDKLFEKVLLLNRAQHRPTKTKLTQAIADAVRADLVAGISGAALAKQHKVSPAVISSIKHGDIWNPEKYTIGTKGTEMEGRLIGAFDGGLRAGEMMDVKITDVRWNPDAYEIALHPTITKGGKSTGQMEYVYAATDRFKHFLEQRRFLLKKNKPEQQYIWGAWDGSHQKGFDRMWQELFTSAGLTFGRDVGIVWHTIRHEFISRLMEQTKDPVLVQAMARHRDLETTLKYSHARRDRQIQAAAGLNRKRKES